MTARPSSSAENLIPSGQSSQSATKRYPRPTTVWRKCGCPESSPSAMRILRIAVLIPCSESTKTSFPHSASAICSRVTNWRWFSTVHQQLQWQPFQAHGNSAAIQLKASEIQFEDAKADSLFCHGDRRLPAILVLRSRLCQVIPVTEQRSSDQLIQLQAGSMDLFLFRVQAAINSEGAV